MSDPAPFVVPDPTPPNYAAINAALTHNEREAFLDKLVGMNPHLAGGKVEDFLDMMMDHDSDLAEVEPFIEANLGKHAPTLGACARVVIHAYGRLDQSRALYIYEQVKPS